MVHFKITRAKDGKDWQILSRGLFRYHSTDYGTFKSSSDAAETLLNDYKGEGIIIHYEN